MTRDEQWLQNYNELKAWLEVHHHYPPEHTQLHNWIRRNIKQRNKSLLPEWKADLILSLENLRTHEHTGGRKKKDSSSFFSNDLFG